MTAEKMTADSVDFAAAAYREDGRWTVVPLPVRVVTTAEGLVGALRQLPGEGGVIGIVSVADEFFLLVRVVGPDVRLVISDAIALLDWSIAQEAAQLIDLEWDEADVEEFEVAGDVDLCGDIGLAAEELVVICQDEELYPDEQVSAVATRLGFGRELADALKG